MAPEIHSTPGQERLVQNQHRACRTIDKSRPDAGARPSRGGCREERWPLESRLRFPSNATFPDDFLAALSKDKKAKAFFDSLNKANRYAISYRLQTAKKPETRQKRMQMILEMLARGEAFH